MAIRGRICLVGAPGDVWCGTDMGVVSWVKGVVLFRNFVLLTISAWILWPTGYCSISCVFPAGNIRQCRVRRVALGKASLR